MNYFADVVYLYIDISECRLSGRYFDRDNVSSSGHIG